MSFKCTAAQEHRTQMHTLEIYESIFISFSAPQRTRHIMSSKCTAKAWYIMSFKCTPKNALKHHKESKKKHSPCLFLKEIPGSVPAFPACRKASGCAWSLAVGHLIPRYFPDGVLLPRTILLEFNESKNQCPWEAATSAFASWVDSLWHS